MSSHEYTRSLTFSGWDIDPYKLALAIEALLPGKPFKVGAEGASLAVIFDGDLSAEEASAVDALVADVVQAHDPLEMVRAVRRNAVNERTEAIIRVGYEFPPGSGQLFSMSDIAQFNLEVANGARSIPGFSYPILFSFKDDKGSYSCPNADTLHAMWLTALSIKRVALDSGRALKDAISAAESIEEIDSIVDER